MLYAGVEAAERHRRATEALHSVGLAGREQNHPNQLSGGQQQRVAIARALVNNPTLILADEPTGALDSRTSVEVMEIFQRLNRERGITLVLVTHEPDIAAYADRVVVFKDGRIQKDYARRRLRATPPRSLGICRLSRTKTKKRSELSAESRGRGASTQRRRGRWGAEISYTIHTLRTCSSVLCTPAVKRGLED